MGPIFIYFHQKDGINSNWTQKVITGSTVLTLTVSVDVPTPTANC